MEANKTNNWIAVASADHARLGHGKGSPLRRLPPGDRAYKCRFGLIGDAAMRLIAGAMAADTQMLYFS